MIEMQRDDQVAVAVPAGMLALRGVAEHGALPVFVVVLRPSSGGAEQELVRSRNTDPRLLVELLRLAVDAAASRTPGLGHA